MVLFKYLLLLGGAGMIATAIAMLTRDLYLISKHRDLAATSGNVPLPPAPAVHWRAELALALLAWGPIILATGIVVVPSGTAGRVSVGVSRAS